MTATATISLCPYRTNDQLDIELAALAYTAVHGWPDQRPITKDLVASRLTPLPGANDTVLALAHLNDQLAGWSALRTAPPGGTARLWGPIVHPAQQRTGIGHQLLQAITATDTYTDCVDRITTAEIPSRRTPALSFFQQAGWAERGQATLLHAHPIPTSHPPPSDLTVAPVPSGDANASYEVARLYQATYPHHGANVAAATLTRWSADRRYTPDNLFLARTATGQAVAAALLYPLAHSDHSEPPEVLLADILRITNDETQLGLLLRHVLTRAAANPDATLRCITNSPHVMAHLQHHGAQATDTVLYLSPPSPRGR